jgi:hypothetical protein
MLLIVIILVGTVAAVTIRKVTGNRMVAGVLLAACAAVAAWLSERRVFAVAYWFVAGATLFSLWLRVRGARPTRVPGSD